MLFWMSTLACTDLTWPEGTGEQEIVEDTGWSDGIPGPFSSCHASNGQGGETVQALSVDGDTLVVDVIYTGGCEDHLFEICWPSASFAYTEPPSAILELWHGGVEDLCDADLTETLSFDLEPLKQAWQDGSDQQTGTLLIQLAGQSDTYTF